MKYINLNELGTVRTIVDDDIYDKYSSFSMNFSKGYVVVRINSEKKYLHRLVLGVEESSIVDHINHDPLDNRRENLRICTIKQNIRNSKKWKTQETSSKYKGVGRKRKKWRAYICVDRKQISLGTYVLEVDAVKAYNTAAVKYFGEFANINII